MIIKIIIKINNNKNDLNDILLEACLKKKVNMNRIQTFPSSTAA